MVKLMPWKTFWPDAATIDTCSTYTAMQWNLHLALPTTPEEIELWKHLRKKYLSRIIVNAKVRTRNGLKMFETLWDLHESMEMMNFVEPLNFQVLTKKNVYNISEMYLAMNVLSEGALVRLIQKIKANYDAENCKAIFYPRIRDYTHPTVDALLDV